ncbi:MAG: outer membrane beta-barrel protein, partial [Desulfovermiculus sp.]
LYHQIFTGLYFSPAAKLKGEIKVGVGRKDYNNERNWQDVAYDEAWEPSLEVELNYLMSEKTEFDLTLLRSTYESVDIDTSSYSRNAAYFTWHQKLIGSFSFQADIGYALEDYETRAGLADRDDDIYELGGKITYAIRDWLHTSLSYRYEERDTSDELFRNEDYVNNLFMWSIKAEL